MDRLPVIKRDLAKSLYDGGAMASEVNDVDWLIAEVERLRRIEDAAAIPKFDEPILDHVCDWLDNLQSVLSDNPRPDTPS
jgi:hypothetical protein